MILIYTDIFGHRLDIGWVIGMEMGVLFLTCMLKEKVEAMLLAFLMNSQAILLPI